jgi:3-hydroxyacyl-CoA dehydrogenase
MHYADTVGAKVIYDAVRRYEAVHGEAWRPAPLLERLAAEGGRFADYARE